MQREALVSVFLSVVASISSTSFFIGGKLSELDLVASQAMAKTEQQAKVEVQLLQTIDAIKTDLAIANNNILWLRKEIENEKDDN